MQSKPPRYSMRAILFGVSAVIIITVVVVNLSSTKNTSNSRINSEKVESHDKLSTRNDSTKLSHVDTTRPETSNDNIEHQSVSHSVVPPSNVSYDYIPESRLKAGFSFLTSQQKERALNQLTSLGNQIVKNDIESLRVDSLGNIYYVCTFNDDYLPRDSVDSPLNTDGESEPQVAEAQTFVGDPVPISSPPLHHSSPGSSKVLYLDFNGGVVSGTAWNSSRGVSSWDCKPYGKDGDDTTFNAEEQALITEIWQRVAENFAPFDIDVTTEEPVEFTNSTAWAMITEGQDKSGVDLPHASSGGIAYVNVFNSGSFSNYSPAWVKEYVNTPYSAYAVSHEIGHNLGLGHDGYTGGTYYGGHESGEYDWAPIMGSSTSDVIQWCQGDYYDSNNDQDDIAIITDKLSLRADDHAGVDASATAVTLTADSSLNRSGIITSTADKDVFALTVPEGGLLVSVDPFIISESDYGLNNEALGAGLDADLKIYDDEGTLLRSNSEGTFSIRGSLELQVSSGTYFIHIEPTGAGSPLVNPPTGYMNYGSLGTYSLACESITTLSLTFNPGEFGSFSSGDTNVNVSYGGKAVAPVVVPDSGYVFTGWDGDIYSVTRGGTVTAQYAKEGAIIFYDTDPKVHTDWDTTVDSDYQWVSTSGGVAGSSTLRNQLTNSWSDESYLTYTATFDSGTIEFEYKRDGYYVWTEFYIDGVKQSMYVADGDPYELFTFPITAGVHTLTWKCVQGKDNYTWIRDIILPVSSQTYTVFFRASGNGNINGTAFQEIPEGSNTTSVEAVPDSSYLFYCWSDGNTDNPRVISGVTESMMFTAQFAPEVIITQTINLAQGKNLVGLRVVPDNKAFSSILSGILDHVTFIRDSNGNTMRKISGTWYNNIGTWQWDRGYLIEMDSAQILEVTGSQIILPQTITIGEGYTIVPFIGDTATDLFSAISNFSGSVEFVRDIDGNQLTPGVSNGIGNFMPGHSYLFKLGAEINLVQP